MDNAFNQQYIIKINELKAEISKIKETRDKLKSINEDLGTKIADSEIELKNKCDKEIIDQVKTSFYYRRRRQRFHKKNEEEIIEVDNFLVDKFNNLTCNENNEYITSKKLYTQELNNYTKSINSKAWLDWWNWWLQSSSNPIDSDLQYYKSIVEEFSQWFK